MAAHMPPMESVVTPSPPSPPPLSLRLVALDYYSTAPSPPLDLCWSELQGEPVQNVPVIRVFGCTPGGQKACIHIHRVLPYFYVPYDQDLPTDLPSATAFARKAAIALDVALNMNPGHFNAPAPHRQRVFDAVLVRGMPFYGYHPEEKVWIKFLLYDPRDVSRAASLLLAGAILGRSFQPHESHVPYLLQFKIDFNLHGMGLIELDTKLVRFRNLPNGHGAEWGNSPQLRTASIDSKDGSMIYRWTTASVRSGMLRQGDEEWREAVTTCELELDAGVEAIRNRGRLKRLPLAMVSSDIRMVDSLAPMWAGVGLSIPSPPPPISIRRSPIPLVSDNEPLWQEFKTKIDLPSTCDPCAPQSDVDGSDSPPMNLGTSQKGEQLLARTQPANEAVMPSPSLISRNLTLPQSQSQSHGQSRDRTSIDHAQFVDRQVVMTQREASLNDEKARGRLEFEQVDRTSDEEDEEDLLLAMAMQLTPLSHSQLTQQQTQQQTQQTQLGDQETGNVVHNDQACFFSSQEQAHRRAQQILDTYIASTLKECDDIIECSGVEREEDEEAQVIHQVDGVWDDDEIYDDKDEKKICTDDSSEQSKRGQLSKHRALLKGPKVPKVPGLRRVQNPGRYMSRDQVKAASNSLAATLNLLGKRKIDYEDEAEEGNDDDSSSSRSIPETEEVSTASDREQSLTVTQKQDQNPVTDGWDDFWGDEEDGGNIPGALLDDYANFEDKELWGGPKDDQYCPALQSKTVLMTPVHPPPSRHSITSSMWDHGLLPIVHPTPFYGDPAHAPKRAVVFAGKEMRVPTDTPDSLDPFIFERKHSKHRQSTLDYIELNDRSRSNRTSLKPACTIAYTPAPFPPSRKAVEAWLEFRNPFGAEDEHGGKKHLQGTQEILQKPASPKYDEMFVKDSAVKRTPSQITMPTVAKRAADTPSSQLGYRRGGCSGKQQQHHGSSSSGEGISLLCLEIVAECRGKLLPDPRLDAVQCVIMILCNDGDDIDVDGWNQVDTVENEKNKKPSSHTRMALLHLPTSSRATLSDAPDSPIKRSMLGEGYSVSIFDSEEALLDAVSSAVVRLDPDILCGFDVRKGSWGYLADRAASALERPNFLMEISRLKARKATPDQASKQTLKVPDEHLHVPGRIVLDVWTLMRQELKLRVYTLQSCCAAVLRRRVPHIPHHQLSLWLQSVQSAWQALSHVARCTFMSLSLLSHLDLVSRTAELARTFGIDFFSVLSRGSQYRVESMMLRLARSQNYVALSPSPEQVAHQPAMECLPLVMEPESGMYNDPVCVLDFQSLYPSMIIAYNLCFSTCVGRPAHIIPAHSSHIQPLGEAASDHPTPPADQVEQGERLGCAPCFRVHVSKNKTFLKGFTESIHLAPNGVGFVKPAVRPGILPRLLAEILETRVMIKGAMSKATHKPMLKTLNARQLGLKLIANVTYGYAAAGFSGRMPMAELADAIVQSGRETLERAIRLVEGRKEWRAKVVYGDTDSLFICLPGRTVDEALVLGKEMAEAVTASNPPPVLLKLEKVYRPCVLMSKKRYVGAMFEKVGQRLPAFDAKGIETVRRDSCPAVAKTLESVLRLLFSNPDLSIVRTYLERQWTKILRGTVSIADFIFSKEVRLGGYAGTLPPAALVAARATAADPRAEPRTGQRVSYVVVSGAPGARLIDMVIPPHELVQHPDRYKLCGVYYITKQIIPALDRVLSLIGVDVRSWFASLPRPKRARHNKINTSHTIDAFYLSRHCAACERLREASESSKGRDLCDRCLSNPQMAAALVYGRVNRMERQYVEMVRVCIACGGGRGGAIACDSLDCPVYFERCTLKHELDFSLRELPELAKVAD